MKKILLAIPAVLLVSSFCFAESYSSTATQQSSTKSSMNKISSGKVKAVSLGDVVKGAKSEITITDDMGKEMTFSVKPTTVISDKDGKQIMLDKVGNGEKASVTYTVTQEGNKEATAIKIAG